MRESSNPYRYRINFSLEMKPNGVRERSARRVGARATAHTYNKESQIDRYTMEYAADTCKKYIHGLYGME